MEYGIICLLPSLIIIILALVTRRVVESLFVGVTVAYIIMGGGFKIPFNMLDSLYDVLTDPSTQWLFLFTGCFGILIIWLEYVGTIASFADSLSKYINSRKKALFITWLMSGLLFIDDYLNTLSAGTAMRRITDKYGISREMIAYIVKSTGANMCVLVPASSWYAFMINQMKNVGMDGTISEYASTIPYMFFPMLSVVIIPLVIIGVIPMFGGMKKAELRAQGGQPLPDSTVAIYGKTDSKEDKKNAHWINFLIPMLVLVAVTVINGDILNGAFAGLITCLLLYLPQRFIKLWDMCDQMVSGFESMVGIFFILTMTFMLQRANEALGLPQFVIDSVEPILNAQLLPVVIFLVVGIIQFCVGSFWGVAAITFPIVIPLAESLDANIPMVTAALIAAAAFGTQACFFADGVSLACVGVQIKNSDYASAVLPYVMIPFVLAVIVYLVAGFLF